MKKLFILSGFITAGFALQAQSVQQGTDDLYYERYQSAINDFSQVTKADPQNAEAWFGLTKAYMLTDKDSAAKAVLATAPPSVKEEPLFEVAQGWVLLAAGDGAASDALFQKALKETKEKNPEVLSGIAQAQIDAATGNAQQAIDLLNKAIKRDKHNAALYVQLGDAYLKAANGSEAYKAYQNAIEENDKYAAAYHSLGQIFLSQKNPDMYLQYFTKAIAADPNYAPSLYKLYVHHFYYDPAKAMTYYKQYMAHSDSTVQQDYDIADLLFTTKDYAAAIEKAKDLEAKEGQNLQPRLYKLIGYSYAEMKDSAQALAYMKQYLAAAPDSQVIAKDYETLSKLYESSNDDSLATMYLVQATQKEKDSASLLADYKKLANIALENKDYAKQAEWLGLYYANNSKANNLDLYNWALATYRAEDYAKADSVFGLYAAKYPEQSFGYYWQARSQSLLDKDMEEGLALPAYQKLIEVLAKDTTAANYKRWMVEAYGYLGAYEANKEKDYEEAIDYFSKMLEVDPQNEEARKNITLLEKRIEK